MPTRIAENVKGDVTTLHDQIADSPHTVALYTMLTANRHSVLVITGNATVARDDAIADENLNQKVADFQQVLHDPARPASARPGPLHHPHRPHPGRPR